MSAGWIGVDLDGTLAEYESVPEELWDPFKIGKPIPKMVARVKEWLDDGKEVRIVTARVWFDLMKCTQADVFKVVLIEETIQKWLMAQGIPPLKVQCSKDYQMLALWDDRAVRVVKNTGEISDQSSLMAVDVYDY